MGDRGRGVSAAADGAAGPIVEAADGRLDVVGGREEYVKEETQVARVLVLILRFGDCIESL